MYNTFYNNVLYSTHNIQLCVYVSIYIYTCIYVHTYVLNFKNPAPVVSFGVISIPH